MNVCTLSGADLVVYRQTKSLDWYRLRRHERHSVVVSDDCGCGEIVQEAGRDLNLRQCDQLGKSIALTPGHFRDSY